MCIANNGRPKGQISFLTTIYIFISTLCSPEGSFVSTYMTNPVPKVKHALLKDMSWRWYTFTPSSSPAAPPATWRGKRCSNDGCACLNNGCRSRSAPSTDTFPRLCPMDAYFATDSPPVNQDCSHDNVLRCTNFKHTEHIIRCKP